MTTLFLATAAGARSMPATVAVEVRCCTCLRFWCIWCCIWWDLSAIPPAGGPHHLAPSLCAGGLHDGVCVVHGSNHCRQRHSQRWADTGQLAGDTGAGSRAVLCRQVANHLPAHPLATVWKAAYWSNPTQYILSALVVNEFTSDDWAQPNPLAPGTTVGESALNIRRAGLLLQFTSLLANHCIISLPHLCASLVCRLAGASPPATPLCGWPFLLWGWAAPCSTSRPWCSSSPSSAVSLAGGCWANWKLYFGVCKHNWPGGLRERATCHFSPLLQRLPHCRTAGLREAVFVSEAALKQRQLMSGAASADTGARVRHACGRKRHAGATACPPTLVPGALCLHVYP